MRRKGDLTLTILEIIETMRWATIEILDTISYYGYEETYRRMRGLKSRMQKREWHFPLLIERRKELKKFEERQKLSKLIHKLQKEGTIAIERTNEQKANYWILTKKGKNKKRSLEQKLQGAANYTVKQTNELKIVIFDIPEPERKKRAWLRSVLKNLKYKMLQKSVWAGNAMLPEQFFKDLLKRNLLGYVEVLAATKRGTLEKIEE
jgi:hypothetical protein